MFLVCTHMANGVFHGLRRALWNKSGGRSTPLQCCLSEADEYDRKSHGLVSKEAGICLIRQCRV
jgi:hypothetical protein